MHTFLDNFHQSGKYSAQLASHQAELIREEKYPDQKCLNISSFQTDYLNLDNSNSGSSRHNEKANSVQTKCTYCGISNHSVEKCFKKIRKEKEKARSAGTSSKKESDHPLRNFFRCGSEDHMIAKCPNVHYPDQKCLNISSFQTDYLNLDNSLSESSRHSEKANSAKAKCTYCVLNNHSVEKFSKKIRKEKEKSRSTGSSSNKN